MSSPVRKIRVQGKCAVVKELLNNVHQRSVCQKKDEIFFFSKASPTANFVQLTRWGGCVGGDS